MTSIANDTKVSSSPVSFSPCTRKMMTTGDDDVTAGDGDTLEMMTMAVVWWWGM